MAIAGGQMAFVDTLGFAARIREAPATIPLIEKMIVDGVPVTLPSKDSPADIQLKPSHSHFEFQFTATRCGNPEHSRFRYRIAGLDTDWKLLSSNRREASLYKPPPGPYAFELQAANSFGSWSDQTARLGFVVVPWWWETLWFRSLAGAMLLAVLFGLFQLRMRQLHRERRRHEAFSRELIASQEAERKRIAAELHDDLGQDLLVIKSRLDTSRMDAGDGQQRGLIGELSGSMTHLIRKVREISHALRPLQLERLGLSSCVRGMVEEVSEATGIYIETDIDDLRGQLSSIAEIGLYRILQEALNNVVKHSDASEVRVALKRGPDQVILSVRDDGRGFSWKNQEEISDTVGHGLAGMAERCRLLGGKFQVFSWPGRGTWIRVEAPIRETPENLKPH